MVSHLAGFPLIAGHTGASEVVDSTNLINTSVILRNIMFFFIRIVIKNEGLTPSTQVAPLEHGSGAHSSMSISQFLPVAQRHDKKGFQ